MEEKKNIGQLFDRIAGTYDRLNHLLSLNIDKIWRRKAVKCLSPSSNLLDVAIGTADLSLEILRQHKATSITGIDLSRRMMEIGISKARRKGIGTQWIDSQFPQTKNELSQADTPSNTNSKPEPSGNFTETAQHPPQSKLKTTTHQNTSAADSTNISSHKCNPPQISFIEANALDMPFADGTFDTLTCAYGIRNFSDLDQGLSEMYRVLHGDSQLLILEFSYPANPLVRTLYDFFFTHLMPAIGKLVSKDPGAYTYFRNSVKNFIWGETMAAHLRQAGFHNVSFKTLTFGITTIYLAHK